MRSSPNLNLVDDLRLLHQLSPETPAMLLWEMTTLRAAKAIQSETQAGSLTVGKVADFVAFLSISNDPLREVLENDALPRKVWVAGREIAP